MLTRIHFGLFLLVVPFLLTISAAQEEEHGPPTLAVGSAAPDFCLKGVGNGTA